MKFTDFKPEELIGKTVLFTFGHSYSGKTRQISKITKVTKTGFKIDVTGFEDRLFSLNNGHQKGLNGRMNMSIVSYCDLITEEETQKYREEFTKNREIKQIKSLIKDKIDNLTYEQLIAIKDIILLNA